MPGFVEIPALDGSLVHVGPASVFRITRGYTNVGGESLTRVEFGDEVQLTRMSAGAVAALLTASGVRLLALTAPDGTAVFVNAGSIAAIRPADPRRDPPNAHAVLTGAGYRQAARETPDELRAAVA